MEERHEYVYSMCPFLGRRWWWDKARKKLDESEETRRETKNNTNNTKKKRIKKPAKRNTPVLPSSLFHLIISLLL